MRLCKDCIALSTECHIPKNYVDNVLMSEYFSSVCVLGYKTKKVFGKTVRIGICPHPLTRKKLDKQLKKRGLPELVSSRDPNQYIKYVYTDE